MIESLTVVAGGTLLLIAVGMLILATAVVADLVGPRRRSWLAEEGRPEPRSPEDWRRASEASARASAARRAS